MKFGGVYLSPALIGLPWIASVAVAGEIAYGHIESGATQPGEITNLLQKAAQDGQVRVLIGLKLQAPGFQPEGNLAPGAVKEQREAIAATQDALLASLQGYEMRVYAVFHSVPSLAVRVDAVALEKLSNSPYVTTIQEDSERWPGETGADVEVE